MDKEHIPEIKSNTELYGFKIYDKWYHQFPSEKLSPEDNQRSVVDPEPRIEKLTTKVNLQGLRVLELGCLEGHHSLILNSLGVKEIIAIEGRPGNFLKCLIVKNAFNLDRCRFLFGDVSIILPTLLGPFDICIAMGILYHLNDPISAIYKIAEFSDSLFVWSHYATEDFPSEPISQIEYKGRFYRGKYFREDMGYSLSSLHKSSFWMFEEDFVRVVQEAGFKNIDLFYKENHPHGPVVTFLAKK